MSDSIDEGLPNLEIKLVKMIDKLIECDEEIEKNGLNSFYFSDELCETKYKKLFEKELPNNSNSDNNSQILNNTQINKSINIPQNIIINKINFIQNNPLNISTIINNNYPQNYYNIMFPQQMNNPLNHSSIYSLNNSCINTTASFSNYEKSLENTTYHLNPNFNNQSNIIKNNINPIFNNSFFDENENNQKALNTTYNDEKKIYFRHYM